MHLDLPTSYAAAFNQDQPLISLKLGDGAASGDAVIAPALNSHEKL
jgi:hypothetical protein